MKFLRNISLWLALAISAGGAPAFADSVGTAAYVVAQANKTALPHAFDFRQVCSIGDSRSAQIQPGSTFYGGYTSIQFLTQFNALTGHPLQLHCAAGVAMLGISGYRSDQYIANNGAVAIASAAGWIENNAPCVNDIAQAGGAGYTTITNPASPNSGVAVTLTNVAAVCAANTQAQVLAELAAGHKVILEAERGATGENQTQVSAMYEVNQRNQDFCDATPGCFWFNANAALWNPISSTTAIAFKAGYSADGTHFTPVGAYNEALEFQRQYGSLFPITDYESCNIADFNASNARSLMGNALFNTLTGGTNGGAGTLSSGTVPSGWVLTIPSGASVAITSAAGTCGNDVTLAVTTTGSGNVVFRTANPSQSLWSLTDQMQFAIQAQVASGSSHLSIYAETDMNGSNASSVSETAISYDMYQLVDGPTTGYTYHLRTRSEPFVSDVVTKGYVQGVVNMYFTAAGSATVTLRRPSFSRTFATN